MNVSVDLVRQYKGSIHDDCERRSQNVASWDVCIEVYETVSVSSSCPCVGDRGIRAFYISPHMSQWYIVRTTLMSNI